MRKKWKQWDFIFMGSKITAVGDCSHDIKRCLLLGRKAMRNLDSILKNTHHFVDKSLPSQSYVLSGSHVQMWELDHKEGWELKNWCFWTVVLEKTLESALDSKEIKPVNPKGNQQWICIGRTVAETEVLNFGQRADSVNKTLMLRKLRAGEEHSRGRDGWMASMTQWTWVWANPGR